jgi:hypothetical protein
MGGGAVTLERYALNTGVRRLCWSIVSELMGNKPYDSRLSIAIGGMLFKRLVYVDVERGVLYRSCRRGESLKDE